MLTHVNLSDKEFADSLKDLMQQLEFRSKQVLMDYDKLSKNVPRRDKVKLMRTKLPKSLVVHLKKIPFIKEIWKRLSQQT
jgi:hypothetical protein